VLVGGAGFTDVAIAPHEHAMNYGGAATMEEALAYSRHIGPAARATADVDPQLRPALDEAIARALAPFETPRGVWIDAATFIVTARSP
jgi:hypothetical protein